MKSNSIKITAAAENLEKASSFIGNRLKRSNISKEIQAETLQIFEALFRNLLRQGYDPAAPVTVRARNSSGEIDINLGFEGKPFVAILDETGPETEDDHFLKEYEDKFDYSYQYGYNSIHITVKRSFQNILFASLSSLLLAVLAYIPIRAYISMDDQIRIANEIVFPLVKLFSNAMLMVGAPVTFFSLLKNLTDIHIISEKNSAGRKLQIKTFITSVITILLAMEMSRMAQTDRAVPHRDPVLRDGPGYECITG